MNPETPVPAADRTLTLARRRQLEGTRRTVARNLEQDTTDPLNPRSAAAAKVRLLARLDEELGT